MDHDFGAILPASLLTLGVLGILITDLLGKGRRPLVPTTVAILSLAMAGLAAMFMDASTDTALGVLQPDQFSILFTVFCCAVGILSIVATMRGEAFRRPGGEFLSLIVASVLGMSVLAMSNDLIMLYLAFETVSIPSYVLVGMRRADARANESSMKYVLFGAVSSGLMLYGLSFLVGLSGGTSLEGVRVAMASGAAEQPIFLVACFLIFAGFAFKISAVPFHFWAPDVYAGAPASIGGFLAVASKAAGFAALVRVVAATGPEVTKLVGDAMTAYVWPQGGPLMVLLAVGAVLSMTFGNLAALKQRDIKRLLAWSSIAHAGYILLALSVWSEDSVPALLLYLIAYLFMNMAAFFIAGLVIRRTGSSEISAFRGFARRNAVLGAGFAIVLFSLTGLPPFFGFIAKLQVFYAVFDQGYVWLGVIGLVNGVVSLYYYVRIIALMFLEETEEAEATPAIGLSLVDRAFCGLMIAPLIILTVCWSGIWDHVKSVAGVFGAGS